jgi:hypothetical protein
MRFPTLWLADFRQRAKRTFHEVPAIHLLAGWECRNFVLTSSIEKGCEHRLLLEMRGSLDSIGVIPRWHPHCPMIVGVKHP